MSKKLGLIFFLFVFIVSFGVYILTLAPSVYLEDAGELIAASYSLGIAHPPGYPVYVILGKLFSLIIPWGGVAYKINLMSAFFGALTCSFVFIVIRQIFWQLTNNRHQETVNHGSLVSKLITYYIVPASASLILAFSSTFWSQSLFAEVYTLNSFFLILIIFLLLKWSQNQVKHKYLLWSAFVFGLSLTNHQMMLLVLPAFLIFIFVVRKRIFLNYKLILSALLLFILGFSVYSFLILRTRYGQPDFVWGDPYNWANFQRHILRQEYNDLGAFSVHNYFNTDKLLYINSLFNIFLDEFTVIGIFLSIVGFICLWFKNKSIWLLITLNFLLNGFLIILLRQLEYGAFYEAIFQVYYLPSFIMLTVFLAFGFYAMYHLLIRMLDKFSDFIEWVFKIVIILILVCIPVSYLISNYYANDKSDFWLIDEYSKNILASLPDDSILLAFSDQPALDSVAFSLMYQQVVNHLRPDVKIVNISNIKGSFYVPVGNIFKGYNLLKASDNERKTRLAEILWEYNKDNLPIYLMYPLGIGADQQLVTRSNGWVYRIYQDLAAAKSDHQFYQDLNLAIVPNLHNSNLVNDMFYRDVVSDYYYARSAYYLENNQAEMYGQALLKAIDFDVSPFSSNYNLFIQHRDIWQGAEPAKELKLPPKEILEISETK